MRSRRDMTRSTICSAAAWIVSGGGAPSANCGSRDVSAFSTCAPARPTWLSRPRRRAARPRSSGSTSRAKCCGWVWPRFDGPAWATGFTWLVPMRRACRWQMPPSMPRRLRSAFAMSWIRFSRAANSRASCARVAGLRSSNSGRLPRQGFAQLYGWYFRAVLPRIGRLVSKHGDAYSYLPASVAQFPPPEAFMAVLRNAGFAHVRYAPLTFGIVSSVRRRAIIAADLPVSLRPDSCPCTGVVYFEHARKCLDLTR